MLWIDKDKCTGCETCIEECPVNTISIINETAGIDMENCICCGICHEVCPEDAVRHDGGKIPDRVEANVTKTKKFMSDCERYLKDINEGQKCLNRMLKHFKNEKIIAEKTLDKLESLKII
jgi:ferredoxin